MRRTVFLLGLAAGSLLLAGQAHAGDKKGRLDYGAPTASDTRVYTGYPDRVPSEVDYRQVNGTYDAEGRWTGTWNGTYEAPDGRRYDGEYEGTVEGAGTSYAPPPPAYDPYYDGDDGYRGGYDAGYDADMERRCGRGGTVGGAVVGGLVGGIAGNRIAGKGNRTEGTIIGGALGAVAGGAIGSAADKKRCDDWWASRGGHYRQGGSYYRQESYSHGGYPPASAYHGNGSTTVYQQGGYGHYGYGAPYGYYTPGVVVTTVITTGAPVVTETIETSTRTYYENVPVKKKRYVAKKKWKPRPKPRCVC
jgi:hypothetical protein